jgi:translation initiation factor 4G
VILFFSTPLFRFSCIDRLVLQAYNAKALNFSLHDSHRHGHRSSSSKNGAEFRGSGRSGTGRNSSSSNRQRSGSSAGPSRQRSGSTQSAANRVNGSIEDPSLPALVKSAARWQIGAAGSTAVLGETAKKIKGILNKITLEKFQKLSEDLMTLIKASVSRVEELIEVVDLVFDKALAEPSFGMIYAELCSMLNQVVWNLLLF